MVMNETMPEPKPVTEPSVVKPVEKMPKKNDFNVLQAVQNLILTAAVVY